MFRRSLLLFATSTVAQKNVFHLGKPAEGIDLCLNTTSCEQGYFTNSSNVFQPSDDTQFSVTRINSNDEFNACFTLKVLAKLITESVDQEEKYKIFCETSDTLENNLKINVQVTMFSGNCSLLKNNTTSVITSCKKDKAKNTLSPTEDCSSSSDPSLIEGTIAGAMTALALCIIMMGLCICHIKRSNLKTRLNNVGNGIKKYADDYAETVQLIEANNIKCELKSFFQEKRIPATKFFLPHDVVVHIIGEYLGPDVKPRDTFTPVLSMF